MIEYKGKTAEAQITDAVSRLILPEELLPTRLKISVRSLPCLWWN